MPARLRRYPQVLQERHLREADRPGVQAVRRDVNVGMKSLAPARTFSNGKAMPYEPESGSSRPASGTGQPTFEEGGAGTCQSRRRKSAAPETRQKWVREPAKRRAAQKCGCAKRDALQSPCRVHPQLQATSKNGRNEIRSTGSVAVRKEARIAFTESDIQDGAYIEAGPRANRRSSTCPRPSRARTRRLRGSTTSSWSRPLDLLD